MTDTPPCAGETVQDDWNPSRVSLPLCAVHERVRSVSSRAEAARAARSRAAATASERTIIAVVAAKPSAPTEKMKIAKTVSMRVKPQRDLIRQLRHNYARGRNPHLPASNPINAKRGRRRRPLSSSSEPLDQVQVITPAEDMAHVLAVSACDAAADQPFGLVVAVAVTVTFWEGVNPTADPSPEK